MACTKIKHVKCLIFGGRRGHVPRRAELKKGSEALFQLPVKQGDVIKVPFPHTNRSTRQSRPALVLSAGSLEDDHGRLWLVIITSARNRGGAGDVAVGNPGTAGLPVPSVIRTAKIASIESVDAAKLGTVPAALFVRVAQYLTRELGLDARP